MSCGTPALTAITCTKVYKYRARPGRRTGRTKGQKDQNNHRHYCNQLPVPNQHPLSVHQ